MKEFIKTYLYAIVLGITVGIIEPSFLKGIIILIPTVITVVITKRNTDLW